jgi:hypothetical protein
MVQSLGADCEKLRQKICRVKELLAETVRLLGEFLSFADPKARMNLGSDRRGRCLAERMESCSCFEARECKFFRF